MKYLPSLPVFPTSHRSFLLLPWTTLLSGVLFCASPVLTAQSVTFTGTQTTLPLSGLSNPFGDAVDNYGDVFVADKTLNSVLELQTQSVNFGSVNICPAGQTTPAPCSETMTLTFTVTASGTLGTPKALTLGAPNLDFTLASGSTCTGASPKVTPARST